MSFFQKISPFYIPPAEAERGGLIVIRERILQSMLLILVVAALPAVISSIWHNLGGANQYLIIVYGVLYLLILGNTLFRDLGYGFRGHVLTLLLYLLAVSELFESGQMGEVRMMLLAFAALTSVLFNSVEAVLAILLGIATIIISSLYVAATPTPIAPAMANLLKGTDWVTASISFAMIASVITGSIAMIIDGLNSNYKKQAELSQSLEYERDTLEDRVQERTRSMARRMVQLRTAAEISRNISALSDPESLLSQVADLIQGRFDLYYVGIFLIDSARQYAVLNAGTGDAGKRMLSQGHQLSIGGSSMIGWAIANRKPRIALDVGAEAVRFNNPNLPLTRSELALPIIAHETVMGAMSIQSEKPNAFDENDIAILESIADSLAIALENDHLYNETRKSLEEIRALNHQYLQQAWSETIETYGELAYEFESQTLSSGNNEANTIQVPLMLRDEVIGQILLEIDRPSLSDDEATLVDSVTTQTAVALENARLLQETERRAVQEQKLNELTTRFSRAQSIEEILRVAAQELGQLPAVAEVAIQLNPAGTPSASKSQSSTGSNGKEHGA